MRIFTTAGPSSSKTSSPPTHSHSRESIQAIQSAQSSMSLTYSMDESVLSNFEINSVENHRSTNNNNNGNNNKVNNNNNNNNGNNSMSSNRQDPGPGPAYELQRSEGGGGGASSRPPNNNAANNNLNLNLNLNSGASYATSTEDSVDYSSYSGYSGFSSELAGGAVVEASSAAVGGEGQYYYADGQGGGGGGLPTVNEYSIMNNHNHNHNNNYNNANRNNNPNAIPDATATVHAMHKQLLHLLSHPELFHDSIDWQNKLDRGMDPSVANTNSTTTTDINGVGDGIQAFDHEFDEESEVNAIGAAGGRGGGGGVGEQKQSEDGDDEPPKSPSKSTKGNEGGAMEGIIGRSSCSPSRLSSSNDKPTRIPTPLPHQIFASDAEVVLPQALTASQLFGLERFTGIELEAAAGLEGLSLLFLRWLALMPEGDHMNIIDPPGLTVMRIAGGRYRVTGAHRVVWRWMNKFSPASSAFQTPLPSSNPSPNALDPNNNKNSGSNKANNNDSTPGNNNEPDDTDFDFGDLVTMTIIDVFETDNDGKLLSYCPTFDNRAVHKTQESIERLRKGASHLREIARSPAGVKVNKAAGSLGKMSLNAALTVKNIVKHKIEEEIHKHQQHQQQQHHQKQKADSDTSADAVGGDDVAEEEKEQDDDRIVNNEGAEDGTTASTGQGRIPVLEREPSRDDQSATGPANKSGSTSLGRGEHYFSDDSTAA